jgi:hypothetical protein
VPAVPILLETTVILGLPRDGVVFQKKLSML